MSSGCSSWRVRRLLWPGLPAADPTPYIRQHRFMDRTDVVFASIGCAGTVHIGTQEYRNDQELYDLLSAAFGDLLAGWEQGDSLYLGVAIGMTRIDMPERPKQRLRPSEERIEAGVEGLIEMVQVAKSLHEPFSETDNDWQPSRQARQRLETLVEHVLRRDAKWRDEHPEAEW